MKSGLTSACLLLVITALAGPVHAQSQSQSQSQSLPDDVLALHWHPVTAERARERTLAAVAWLEGNDGASGRIEAIDAIALDLRPVLQQAGPLQVSVADGLMAWLVWQRGGHALLPGAGFPEPGLSGVSELLEAGHASGRLARKRVVAAYRADAIWAQVIDSMGEEAAAEIAAYWAPLVAELDDAGEAENGSAAAHARRQARRVRELAAADSAARRMQIHDEILQAQARRAWDTGRLLDALWFSFEGLVRLLQAEDSASDIAAQWSGWLEAVGGEQGRALRLIDVDLPVVLALLGDAASALAAPEQSFQPAIAALADSYARLALFAPDLAFYLDQPVREGVRRMISACKPEPLFVGPLPRDAFERCADNLETMLVGDLGTEELVGEAQGPFAVEFLRRELGLISWQRVAYLDGHLDWLLEAQCQPPEWVNVLEWSLLADHLVRWVAQRPAFLAGQTWRDTVDRLTAQMRMQATAHAEWIDCVTGRGGSRRDPVTRLLARHHMALIEVQGLLREARTAFYDSVTRPGADVDLDGPADQATAYRPPDQMVGPCPAADSCGARVELPASRALLGLFPDPFLLADQIGMGELGLCYDQVRWVERSMEPARWRSSRVADYYGRFSFDLVGTFQSEGKRRTVFRHRLTDRERQHYLFAAADEAILAEGCPNDWIGRSVASKLPEKHPGLVPNRLTYFASTPTTPEAELLANWAQGAQWHDWFVAGRHVQPVETADPANMEAAVEAGLVELATRRERQLVAPLINPPRAGDEDPLVLAMSRVADTAALLRRILELHYPRIIRQHAPIRSMVSGEAGLITRDRVRLMREQGVAVSRIPELGLERAGRLRNTWLELPEALREQGQRAPEIDYSLERLSNPRLSNPQREIAPQALISPP